MLNWTWQRNKGKAKDSNVVCKSKDEETEKAYIHPIMASDGVEILNALTRERVRRLAYIDSKQQYQCSSQGDIQLITVWRLTMQ